MQLLKRWSMTRITLVTAAGCAVFGACAQNSGSSVPPASTATTASTAGPNVMADLLNNVDGIEKKFVDLAKAMPEASYDWRPMPGVRSVREVFRHISGENFLLPSFFGVTIPAATGIVAGDFKTVDAYEKRELKKDSVVADLEASFANIKKAMAADSAAVMSGEVDFFGTKMSRQAAWIGTVTHMHEHLGQAIAYARSNKIVPPWSK